jgi:hypothetical protein
MGLIIQENDHLSLCGIENTGLFGWFEKQAGDSQHIRIWV